MAISSEYQDYVVFVDSKALRARSKAEYLRQVRKLAEHHPTFQLSAVTERAVFDYLIHLRDQRRFRPSTLNQALVALRLFYRDFLGFDWKLWDQFTIRRDQPLPVVLTRAEVQRLFGVVKEPRFKVLLTLIYHCGLRITEAIRLTPKHIDAERNILRVLDGKGGRNREIPIAPRMIECLRDFWRSHRNPNWIFPGPGNTWRDRSRTMNSTLGASSTPMSVASVQAAMRLVVVAARIKKPATPHSLRHSFATQLLEAGVSIRQVSTYLGHASIQSTLVYLHVTEISEVKGRDAQARLLDFVLTS